MKLSILLLLLPCLIALAPDSAATDIRSLLIGGESRPAIVLHDNASLRGARIVGHDSSLLGCAVLVRGCGVVIEECLISENAGTGIDLEEGSSLKLSRSNVSINGGDGLVLGALCRAESVSVLQTLKP